MVACKLKKYLVAFVIFFLLPPLFLPARFVVFAGLDQVMQFLKDGFKFSKEDTAYLRYVL
jgi:nicotinic acid phosphoribosyltransferase